MNSLIFLINISLKNNNLKISYISDYRIFHSFCLIQEKRYEKKSDMKKVVITRNVDSALQEVLDLTIRDHILSWYSDLSKDQEAFLSSLR